MKTPTKETLKELDDLREIVNTISTMTDAIKSNQDLIKETLKELDDQILREIVNTISTMTDVIKSNQDLIKELIVKVEKLEQDKYNRLGRL